MLAHLPGAGSVDDAGLQKLRVIHVTTHIGLIDAIARIEPGLVERVIARGHAVLVKAGIAEPMIGVCAINPHAGENGLFGHGEEPRRSRRRSRPAAPRAGRARGPCRPTRCFFLAGRGDYDMVVPCITIRAMARSSAGWVSRPGVNITVGLPVIRTSSITARPFDIAGTGVADERSLIEALRQAVELAPKSQAA